MVGSRKGGNTKDPDVEGWSGLNITQVAAKARAALPKYTPNIVTILLGTNNMAKDETAKPAPESFGNLIDEILARPEMTAVIASTLPPLKDKNANERVKVFNSELKKVVKTRADKGKWVLLVDSNKVLTLNDLVDGMHPGDGGFEKIAKVFYDGITQAGKNNWISTPTDASVRGKPSPLNKSRQPTSKSKPSND